MQWEHVPDDTPTSSPPQSGEPAPGQPAREPPAPTGRPARTDPHQAKLIGVVVAAGLGVLMILFGDFGGWYHTDVYWDSWLEYYATDASSGYVHMFTSPLAFLLLGGAIAGLVLAGLAAMARLGWVPIPPHRLDRAGFAGGAASAAIAVFGAIIFFALAWEADEVWLDTAFFGAIGAGALTAGLLWASGALKSNESRAAQDAL